MKRHEKIEFLTDVIGAHLAECEINVTDTGNDQYIKIYDVHGRESKIFLTALADSVVDALECVS